MAMKGLCFVYLCIPGPVQKLIAFHVLTWTKSLSDCPDVVKKLTLLNLKDWIYDAKNNPDNSWLVKQKTIILLWTQKASAAKNSAAEEQKVRSDRQWSNCNS